MKKKMIKEVIVLGIVATASIFIMTNQLEKQNKRDANETVKPPVEIKLPDYKNPIKAPTVTNPTNPVPEYKNPIKAPTTLKDLYVKGKPTKYQKQVLAAKDIVYDANTAHRIFAEYIKEKNEMAIDLWASSYLKNLKSEKEQLEEIIFQYPKIKNEIAYDDYLKTTNELIDFLEYYVNGDSK